jgi:hypothetical protein
MGYDLHITRKKNWDGFEDERGAEVSFDEWTTLVNVDRDMRLDGFCEVPLADGRKFRHADPSIAVWTAWSHHGEAGDMAWFSLRHGNVVVKNPDREIRRKMWWLARSLKAKVQGEGSEFYDRFGNPTRDAARAQDYLLALFRHLGIRFIHGDPVGGDYPPRPFARFPVVDFISPSSPNSGEPLITRRVLNIVVPKGSGTSEQRAAIEAAKK